MRGASGRRQSSPRAPTVHGCPPWPTGTRTPPSVSASPPISPSPTTRTGTRLHPAPRPTAGAAVPLLGLTLLDDAAAGERGDARGQRERLGPVARGVDRGDG